MSKLKLPAEDQRLLESSWAELTMLAAKLDPVWFVETYFWVESTQAVGNRARFELWDYQKETLLRFFTQPWHVILKARQQGFTTLTMAFILLQCLINPGWKALVVSRRREDAYEAIRKMRVMWNNLPEWMHARYGKVPPGKERFVLKHPDGRESQVLSVAATDGAGAGFTADFVFLDEFALYDVRKAQSAYATIKPSLDAKAAAEHWSGALMVLASTARGPANPFARIYKAAKSGVNDFVATFVPWMKSEFVTEEVYETKRADYAAAGTPWRIHSEYPATDDEAFRESNHQRFKGMLPDPLTLEDLPISGEVVDRDGSLHVKESTSSDPLNNEGGPLFLETLDADPDKFYVIALDPALGTGGDYSAAHIIEADLVERTAHIVGYYRTNRIEQGEVARDLAVIGNHFRGAGQDAALMVVERAGGWGTTPVRVLRELRYPNLYREKVEKGRTAKRADSYGLKTSRTTKPQYIDHLAACLSSGSQWELSGVYPELRNELGTFVVKTTPSGNDTVQADDGAHDDLVMSLALALWAVRTDAPDRARSAVPPSVRGHLFLDREGWEEEQFRQAEERIRASKRASRRRRRRLTSFR